MKIYLSIFCLFIFSLIKSQNLEPSDFRIHRSSEKNCDLIKICFDSAKTTDNSLFFNLHIKDPLTYKPERSLSCIFKEDSLFISYYSKPKDKDPISLSLDEFDKGCKVFIFEFKRLTVVPKYFVYNQEVIPSCPITFLSYSIYQGDTINIINHNGFKESKWIDFYNTGEILKVKEYKNGQFIKGILYDKSGRITHVVSDEGVEVSMPIEFYKETHK